ncbi:hypothetical protein GCM10025881_11090 [Pseudolysinimonas kribbensis]|uniref:UDP-glucose/GDP-mannose dehydrogenase C-terminal domain-containing protein n=1 Tax=Pseudolysinimonas kribbensis TaxID=433641 RepID=A0ABQ6K5E6_9MICO|nr:hypothetical protein GCM10025881_11090 [Pseudolysinimonas kribbensis]
MLGIAFKPESDDVRDSPALEVVRRLVEAGAHVTATDPRAIASARRAHPELTVDYRESAEETMRDADAVVLLTEWVQFRDLDPRAARALVRRALLVDGRNALDATVWADAGWRVRGLGRAAVGPGR